MIFIVNNFNQYIFHHGPMQSRMEAALAVINKEHRLNAFDSKEDEEDLCDLQFFLRHDSQGRPTDTRSFPILACCMQDWLETESGLHRGCASYVTMRTRKNPNCRPGSKRDQM